MKVTIYNHFHNTRAAIYSAPGRQLTEYQERKLRKQLCGIRGCECGALQQGDARVDDFFPWCDDGKCFVASSNLLPF